jgi:hypothetical protein
VRLVFGCFALVCLAFSVFCLLFLPAGGAWWRACLRTVYEGHVTFPGSIGPCSIYEEVVWPLSSLMALHVEQPR